MSEARRPSGRLFLNVALAWLLSSVATGGLAWAQPAFPPGSAVGLVPPPGYAIAKGSPGFASQDGSATIMLAGAPPAVRGVPPTLALAQLVTFADRRLAAAGVRETYRRPLNTSAFVGSLVQGTIGAGHELETVWVLYFVGREAMGSVAWRLAGTATAEQSAEMERAFASVVTRTPAPLDEQLATLPFTFDTSVYDLTRLQGASVILGSLDRDEQMLIAVLPSPSLPEQDHVEVARRLLGYPIILSMVSNPAWESSGPEPLAGHDGVALRARVTHTATSKAMRIVLRVGILPDGNVLVALGCAPAPNEAAFTEATKRFSRVSDSLVLR